MWEQALAWLPARPTGKPLVVRGDSALATKGFVAYARSAGVKLSLSLPIGAPPRSRPPSVRFTPSAPRGPPAVRPDGSVRDGAHVAELADVPLDGWGDGCASWCAGSRCGGVQQTFDDIRWAPLHRRADRPRRRRPRAVEAHHRAHARVEESQTPRRTTGLANLACGEFARNSVWAALIMVALALASWILTLLLHGELTLARPPTLG